MLATYVSGCNDYSAEARELMLDRDLVQLWTVSDGRGSFLRVYRTKAEALQVAGLQE